MDIKVAMSLYKYFWVDPQIGFWQALCAWTDVDRGISQSLVYWQGSGMWTEFRWFLYPFFRARFRAGLREELDTLKAKRQELRKRNQCHLASWGRGIRYFWQLWACYLRVLGKGLPVHSWGQSAELEECTEKAAETCEDSKAVESEWFAEVGHRCWSSARLGPIFTAEQLQSRISKRDGLACERNEHVAETTSCPL